MQLVRGLQLAFPANRWHSRLSFVLSIRKSLMAKEQGIATHMPGLAFYKERAHMGSSRGSNPERDKVEMSLAWLPLSLLS